MSEFIIRPSGILKHDDCPRSYQFQYEMGLRTEAVSINLPFGTAVHQATTDYLIAEHYSQSCNVVDIFKETFTKKIDTSIIEVSSSRSIQDYFAIGERLVEQFPETWDKSGLMLCLDKEGKPIVERRMKATLSHNLVLNGQPDIVALDSEGDVCLVDIKTPAQVSDSLFLKASDQLTCYQLLLEYNANDLGIDGVQKLGFMEGVKRAIPKTGRGAGPGWEPIQFAPARDDSDRQDLIQKVLEIKRQRDIGYFPKRSRMAYNTPCTMCDFRHYCVEKDVSDIVFPEEKESRPEPIKLPASF